MADAVFDPDEVDAAWLTDVLGASAEATGEVTSVTAERIGAGKVGDNVRFTLTWSPPHSGPATVVGKFPSPDPMSRAAGVSLGNYEREVRFYTELAHTVAVRAPACHFAALDEATGDFVLLLADLAPATVGDQVAGCSVDDAAAAVDELVALHAPRWGDPALTTHGDWLGPRLVGGGEALADAWRMMLPAFVERFADRLDDATVSVAERFVDVVDEWVLPLEGPLTLTHNDYRLDNLLFGTNPTDGSPYCAVVDWQTIGLGPGVADVAYVLGAGLLPDERRRSERDLLTRYLDGLAAAGVDLDAERAWWEYRRTAPAGLVMAVFASMVVGPGERSDEMFLAMARRHAAQMADLGVPGLLDPT